MATAFFTRLISKVLLQKQTDHGAIMVCFARVKLLSQSLNLRVCSFEIKRKCFISKRLF
jgi:hypothetical protein